MVRLHLLDTTGDPPAQTWRNANLDRTLMTSLLSTIALIIVLYMICLRLCPPRLTERQCRPTEPSEDRVEQLKSIPVARYRESSPASRVGDETCAVCLAEYVQGEEVRVLPTCGHVFHRECVDRWMLHGSWLCPICREPPVTKRDGGGGGIAIAVADAEEQGGQPGSSC